MKTKTWFTINLSLLFWSIYGVANASAIIRTPAPLVIPAFFNESDIEFIMQSLMIHGYSAKVTDFIERHLPLAVIEMQQTGIPASITLAQLILESGYGSSELFKQAKNGFGIKDKLKDNSFLYKGGHYKQYNDIRNSFRDHSSHLLEKNSVKKLLQFKVRDLYSWTQMLTDIEYAEDHAYQAKIENIIKRYSFFEIDKFVWAAADDIYESD